MALGLTPSKNLQHYNTFTPIRCITLLRYRTIQLPALYISAYSQGSARGERRVTYIDR
jgi:hypothetical protein